MKAVEIVRPGGTDVLRFAETERPVPAADQVLLQVHAIGVNFMDIYYREGIYPAPMPSIPGQEGAGVIVETGADVQGFQAGERVAWCMYLGAYAEYAVVPAKHLVRIPDGVTFEQAAAVLLQGMTAQYLSTSTYQLKPGDTALVHAAAGGVGLLLTQMAAQAGAQVIAAVSSEEKARMARTAGAHEAIVYGDEDFEQAVKRLTHGEGVDVVYDSVGKTTFEKSLQCLRPRGLMVLLGSSSGLVPPVDPIHLSLEGSLFFTRPSLTHYTRTREELDMRAGDVFARLQNGKLNVRIHAMYPLSEAARAQQELQSRRTMGKLLLLPGIEPHSGI
jgi:NADPH2:quinone reductase